VLDKMRDEPVHRASIANNKHILVPEVEGVVPICAVEDGTTKIVNLPNILSTVRHITEAHGGNQKPRVPDVAAIRPPVNEMDAPENSSSSHSAAVHSWLKLTWSDEP
jgi:hypothetical protein